MPWKDVKVSDQRIRFVLRASSGREEMAGLCREFGISRPTGYLWLNRFRETDRIEDLRERSRRPLQSPAKTSPEVEAKVIEERRRRPDWGARKLQALLAREGVSKPRSTIHRVLQRNGLVKPQNQHPPALKRFERAEPNQLWQMDFKGLPANMSQGCAPLSILDDCSRYALGLVLLPGTQSRPVRTTLESIFRSSGVPDAMLMDHGTPWWNAAHPWGWTQLSIWLMRQGIRLHFAAIRHPQTQGKVERFHHTLEDALCERGFPQREEWPAWLEAFRQEYNWVRPHEALGMAVPASRWRPSAKLFLEDPPEWEYPAGAEVRQVRASGQLAIENHEYTISGALAGERIAIERLPEARLLVFYRATCIREINLRKRQSYPVYFWREQPIFDEA
jgi:transposase InsO family protein